MTATLLPGEPVAEKIRAEVASRVAAKKPRVAAIHNEKPGPVRVYMKQQKNACEKVGIPYDVHPIGDMKPDDVYALIGKLVADPAITGITVHQPMPKGINEPLVLSMVP